VTNSLRDYSTLGGNFPNVVVTSMVATTSVGEDLDSTWKGLLAGESGIKTLTDDWVEEYALPVRFGGRLVKDPTDEVSRVQARRMAYVERIAYMMCKRLWVHAGEPDVEKDRLGVVIGTGVGGGDALI
jgi:beta-ketoacyl ACP synthase